MKTTLKSKDLDQLLAEADELLQQLDPEIFEYFEEEQRAQLEEQARNLKRLKSEVQEKISRKGIAESSSFSEGTHEAIEDIVKAMQTMAGYLSPKMDQAS